jgi:hypothetical protein
MPGRVGGCRDESRAQRAPRTHGCVRHGEATSRRLCIREKRGQTALSTAGVGRFKRNGMAGTEWSVPFFRARLGGDVEKRERRERN